MVRTINMDTGFGYRKITFPDSQPHIVLEKDQYSNIASRVVCSLTSPGKIVELLMIHEACLGANQPIWSLHIPYLMGARYDRRINEGDSFDLKVIADMINSMEIGEVHLYDPHSNVSENLIKNSVIHGNEFLVKSYDLPDSVLIVPDAGAAKKAEKYPIWNSKITSVVQCLKKRDLETGKVLGVEIFGGEKCAGKNAVIIDDLCDGGRTFTEIIWELRNQGWIPDFTTLIVTHGIFSKGFADLSKCFDHIITSNSYWQPGGDGMEYKPRDAFGGLKLKVVPINYHDDLYDK